MQKRTFKVAVLAVLAVVLVLAFALPAFADATWSDLPDTVTAKYGVTDNQVAAISEGFPGGLWKPYQSVTRAQFTKMAVACFGLNLVDPATASFTDVPKGSIYFKYIEGAKAVGLINGTTATTFSPNANITRQQAIAIVARYIAKVNGYDLKTMYSATELDALLKHFGDAASVAADLKNEVAFAFDMGLSNGDAYGNVAPLANLTRIQGAAFLLRAKALVPPQHWTAAKIELVSTDKTEGLIGQPFKATFQVTDATGHPAIGVLVDVDSLVADFYVGNTSPEAALTNNEGQVTVNMLSMEPGTQRLSASVQGLGTIYTTRYWLALDEVYNVDGATSQNNAGVEHTWGVRTVVFGPGPESTSVSDWYNAIYTTVAFDKNNINVIDGVDANDDPGYPMFLFGDGWTYADELVLAKYGYKPRTLAGIDVKWAIVNKLDDPLTKLTNEAETSVGNITKVDGAAITPAKTATGKTDANGLSTIVVYSEQVGHTYTQAIADYLGNPYPQELFNHGTFEKSVWWHNFDWDDQPTDEAFQTKTWIAHTISSGTTAGPITLAYQTGNIGEEKTLTITLKDTYGNPVAGKYVEWFMQGVGFFQTDDSGDQSDPDVAANNHDYDVTNAAGVSTLFVKSYDAGEQIIHAKVRDKGTGGNEGTFNDTTYTAEVQWFDADIVTFDNITTQSVLVDAYTDVPAYMDYKNEAVSSNPVNTSHTFDLWVYGLKLEYDPTVLYADGQTPLIDSDAAGHSYDAIIDANDATYFGGILMWPMPPQFDGGNFSNWSWFENKMIAPWSYTFRFPAGTVADSAPLGTLGPKQRWAFDWDQNGVIEKHSNVTEKDVGWDQNGDGKIDLTPLDETGNVQVQVAGVWTTLSFEGAYTMYDYDEDGYKEPFEGVPGIYLPLAGKTVTFSKANADGPGFSNLGTVAKITGPDLPLWLSYPYGLTFLNYDFNGAKVAGVGSITAPTTSVTTDAAGKASVTITSNTKGPETIKAVVTWPGNPHNGPELLSAYAKKNWTAGTVAAATDVTVEVYIDGVKVATSKDGELAVGNKAMWTWVNIGSLQAPHWVKKLNSAHVEVHVKDAYGNDLPDYEVVYLLENIDETLGGAQNAVDTRIPFAHLFDANIYNNASGDPTNTGSALFPNYDQNGPAPDSDEPSPASDPYAYIVGPGFDLSLWNGSPSVMDTEGSYHPTDHAARFFNQWLGSDQANWEVGMPGLPNWWTHITNTVSPVTLSWFWMSNYWLYHAPAVVAWNGYHWPSPYPSMNEMFDGFDGIFDGLYEPGVTAPDDIHLATDGAKAWTLDGYIDASSLWGTDSPDIEPNLLTGSNIDIQLDEGNYLGFAHYKSILRVMVYAPADGLTKEGTPIFSQQVHEVWAPAVPTTITLSPASDYAIAGLEEQSFVATVKDQFGNPVPNQKVNFFSGFYSAIGATWVNALLEGDVTQLFVGSESAITDANGNAAVNLHGATNAKGEWGAEQVYAYIDSVTTPNNLPDGVPGVLGSELVSNPAVIQWIKIDNSLDPGATQTPAYIPIVPTDLLQAYAGDQKVTVDGGALKNYGADPVAPSTGWNGMTLKIYTNPGGNVLGAIGSGTYVSMANSQISTNTTTWPAMGVGSQFFVNASTSTNYDGVCNWVYDQILPAVVVAGQ